MISNPEAPKHRKLVGDLHRKPPLLHHHGVHGERPAKRLPHEIRSFKGTKKDHLDQLILEFVGDDKGKM